MKAFLASVREWWNGLSDDSRRGIVIALVCTAVGVIIGAVVG